MAQEELHPNGSAADDDAGEYLVVARRYRPQLFSELVGQQQVVQALQNAINSARVGHAYLFTGARGTGKTTTARIFARCLNCVNGPTTTPCGQCDACQGIAVGDDVDVLEIDGASNRGIDEIRELRANVNVRPSRSRFKIYIIDEVHMLTTQAFNALLKTLEEPPEHVKFIFCTTDPEDIPITVLSRCQRFDFVPVQTAQIMGQLRKIVEQEGIGADDEALQLLARRAAGSMRDSQSLLEQLLSFCDGKITAADVHRLLGTAHGDAIWNLLDRLVARDAAGALGELEKAISGGIDPGQLAEQLLGYLRDLLAVGVGGGSELLHHAAATEHGRLQRLAQGWGVETALAVAQIVDQCLVKMRQSLHARTLLEIALVRICRLENLASLSQLIGRLEAGVSIGEISAPAATDDSKKKELTAPAESPREEPRAISPALVAPSPPRPEPPPPRVPPSEPSEPPEIAPAEPPLNGHSLASPPAAAGGDESAPVASPQVSSVPFTVENLQEIWRRAVTEIGGMVGESLGHSAGVAISGPNRLAVSFAGQYTYCKRFCDTPERKSRVEEVLAGITGHPVRVDFLAEAGAAGGSGSSPTPAAAPTAQKLRKEALQHPLILTAVDLFDGEIVRVDQVARREVDSPAAAPPEDA